MTLPYCNTCGSQYEYFSGGRKCACTYFFEYDAPSTLSGDLTIGGTHIPFPSPEWKEHIKPGDGLKIPAAPALEENRVSIPYPEIMTVMDLLETTMTMHRLSDADKIELQSLANRLAVRILDQYVDKRK